MKKTLILQCPGMVYSPPVVSKCLGEAHRRLGIIYIIYITLHYINPFFFFPSILLVIRKQKSSRRSLDFVAVIGWLLRRLERIFSL